ncbi:class I SAM-dependent methyltransferase [Alphaproteobacteria bacterium]|nr:class I SAM-dependent methyltransferase [Alphaproteobacteria bacterium]
MKNYLSVVYDEKSHPYNEYPMKLCSYLFNLFELKKGMKLLEPGCGRGDFLSNFKKLDLDVEGVDISSESLNFDNDLKIKLCDIEKEKLPFSNDTFDVVFSKSFIEHLSKPEKYLEESFRVLKPGGILLTLVPDWESNYKKYFDDFTHKSPFTKIALEDAYKMFGFSDINVFKFRQLPIVWKYPILNFFCAAISPLIPVRVENKFFRWSRELMLVGSGVKK